MSTIHALAFRLSATKLVLTGGAIVAHLTPVHSNDPANPNASFSKSSANASLEFTITNPDAFDFLKPDAVYDLVMIPRDSDVSIQVSVAATPQPDAPSGDAEVDASVVTAQAAAPAALEAPTDDIAPPASAQAADTAAAAVVPVEDEAPIEASDAPIIDAAAAAIATAGATTQA